MKTLINTIIAQVAIFGNTNAAFKALYPNRKLYVAENAGQMDADAPAVAYPCALVKIDQCNWQELSSDKRLGNVTFSVLLADILPGGSTPPRQTEAMRKATLLDIAEAVALFLEANTSLPNVDYTALREIDSKKGIRQISLSFATSITRAKAIAPQTTEVNHIRITQLPNSTFDPTFDRTFE